MQKEEEDQSKRIAEEFFLEKMRIYEESGRYDEIFDLEKQFYGGKKIGIERSRFLEEMFLGQRMKKRYMNSLSGNGIVVEIGEKDEQFENFKLEEDLTQAIKREIAVPLDVEEVEITPNEIAEVQVKIDKEDQEEVKNIKYDWIPKLDMNEQITSSNFQNTDREIWSATQRKLRNGERDPSNRKYARNKGSGSKDLF